MANVVALEHPKAKRDRAMMRFGTARHALGIGVAVTMLAGCGGSQTATSGTVPALSTTVRSVSGPPACKRQRTKPNYGGNSAKLERNGGTFCIPAFGGFGGSLQYPGVERSVRLTMRTSVENLYDEPQLGNGTSMVYLNIHFRAGTHFGSNLKSGGGLTSQTINVGDTYTAYGIVAVGHLDLMFPPCFTVATQGPYGGVLPNLGNLFSSTTITGAGFGVIEIYSGQQVSQEC
jgi:hypothetical protein